MLPELFSAVCTDLSHCVTTLVPESMRPIVVKYNPGAFEAAGFPPPSSTWTIDDFEAACSALQTALDHGKLASAGVAEVLYPFGGYAYDIETGTSTVTLGTLADPVLWQAFIAGYGGTLVSGSEVHWDQGQAYDGISRLMDIYARFGAAQPPAGSDVGRTYDAAAIAFVEIPAVPIPLAGGSQIIGIARFPRLPVEPVAPVRAQNLQLAYRDGLQLPKRLAPAAERATSTAVEYLKWSVQDSTQALFADYGLIPITAAALAQTPRWEDLGVSGPDARPLLAYPWPEDATTFNLLHSGLPALARRVSDDPESRRSELATFSQQLSSALAKANSRP